MALTLSPGGRRYGYLKDRPDHRDFGISSSPLTTVGLPSSFDLESFCGPVLDQGQEGSCTAHFGAGVDTFLQKKWATTPRDIDPSPSFIYWLSRQMDNFMAVNNRWPTNNDELFAFVKTSIVTDDTGSYGRTVCRVLNKFGAASRTAMPYVAGDFATAPNDAQLADGLSYKAGAYHRIQNVQDRIYRLFFL
jgi:hypothetical protein